MWRGSERPTGRGWPKRWPHGFLFLPSEEKPRIAGKPLGEIEDFRRQMKSLRLQFLLPAFIKLVWFAPQRVLPAILADIDGAAAIGAELAGKARELEFGAAGLGRFAGAAHQLVPLLIADMSLAELLDRLLGSFGGFVAVLFSLFLLFFLIFRGQ